MTLMLRSMAEKAKNQAYALGVKLRVIRDRKGAFQRIFDPDNPDAQIVLETLMRYCRATRTTFHPDPHVHSMLSGRRDVWCLIQSYCHHEDETLYAILEEGKTRYQ